MSILFNNLKYLVAFSRVLSRALVTLAVSLFAAQIAIADAPLKSKLDLSVEQANTVSQIQKRYRAEKRSIRQVLNRSSRLLRRAKSANDSEAIASLSEEVATFEWAMRAAIRDEDNEIRQVLEPEQLVSFEDYIDTRDKMIGSSRDVRVQ